jgi:hypothetical protein
MSPAHGTQVMRVQKEEKGEEEGKASGAAEE